MGRPRSVPVCRAMNDPSRSCFSDRPLREFARAIRDAVLEQRTRRAESPGCDGAYSQCVDQGSHVSPSSGEAAGVPSRKKSFFAVRKVEPELNLVPSNDFYDRTRLILGAVRANPTANHVVLSTASCAPSRRFDVQCFARSADAGVPSGDAGRTPVCPEGVNPSPYTPFADLLPRPVPRAEVARQPAADRPLFRSKVPNNSVRRIARPRFSSHIFGFSGNLFGSAPSRATAPKRCSFVFPQMEPLSTSTGHTTVMGNAPITNKSANAFDSSSQVSFGQVKAPPHETSRGPS